MTETITLNTSSTWPMPSYHKSNAELDLSQSTCDVIPMNGSLSKPAATSSGEYHKHIEDASDEDSADELPEEEKRRILKHLPKVR